MKVDARLTFATIRHDQPADAHLVISLTAPPLAEESKRAPICIVAAIDVSPSMEGAKLAYAKRSAIKMIDHLQPGDYFGLVDFAEKAQLRLKPTKVTPAFKDEAKRAVGALHTRSATNIADALLVSLDAANRMDLGAEVITRCLLFTDGDANTGVAIRPADILALLEKNLGIATVSAFGYGEDVKQDLLADIARIGKANYAFVKNPDDALSAFGKELGGLVSQWATDIVVDVSPLVGHEISSIISDVEAEEDVTGHLTIRVPDLLAEETRHFVMSVKLAPQKSFGPRAVNVFEAKIHFDVIGADGRKERKTVDAKVKAQFVKAGDEQKEPAKDVDALVGQAQIVRAQIDAEKAVQRGDYKTAGALFQNTAQSLQGRGHADLGGVVSYVSDMYANADSYRSTTGNRAGLRAAMTRAVGTSSLAAQDAVVLTSARLSLSNSSQSSMMHSFTEVPEVETPEVEDTPAPLDLGYGLTATPEHWGGSVSSGGLGSLGWTGNPNAIGTIGVCTSTHTGGTSTPVVGPSLREVLVASKPAIPVEDPAVRAKRLEGIQKAMEKGAKGPETPKTGASKRIKQSKSNTRW